MNDIDAFSDDWVLAEGAESTLTTYRQILAKAPFELPGTIREAKGWLSERRREVTPATVVVHVRALKAYSRWWAGEHDEPDPLGGLDFPKVPTAAPGKIISDADINRLRQALGRFSENPGRSPLRDRAILEVFVHTGMRRSELIALDLSDIDFTTDRITVAPSKNGEARRVPIHSDLRVVLKRYIRHERAHHRQADQAPLFLGREGRLRSDSITSLFRRLSRRAGFNEPIGTHEFRRRFADQWIEGGGADDHLMVIAGWKSPAMPARYRAANLKDRALSQYDKILDPQRHRSTTPPRPGKVTHHRTKDGRVIRRGEPRASS